MELELNIKERKDHLITILTKRLRTIIKGIELENLIILKIKNKILIRKIRADYVISIPKKLSKKGKNTFKLVGLVKRKEALLRNKKQFIKDQIYLDSLVPLKTRSKKDIYLIKLKNKMLLHYPVAGGAKGLLIKRKFNAERIGEILGFYVGDGVTAEGIQSFRLVNAEPSVIKKMIYYFKQLGIPEENWKFQIILSHPNEEISNKIKNKCKTFWNKELNLNKNQIVSVLRSKSKYESKICGSIRMFLDNNLLVELFLKGLLPFILQKISNPKSEIDYKILRGFTRGIFAAEVGPGLREGVLSRINVSFNYLVNEDKLFRRLLTNLKIYPSLKQKKGEFDIYGIDNFKKINELGLFNLHDKRKKDFKKGLFNHKFFQDF